MITLCILLFVLCVFLSIVVFFLAKKALALQDELEIANEDIKSAVNISETSKKSLEQSLYVIDKILKMRVSTDEPEVREVIKAIKNARDVIKKNITTLT